MHYCTGTRGSTLCTLQPCKLVLIYNGNIIAVGIYYKEILLNLAALFFMVKSIRFFFYQHFYEISIILVRQLVS